MAGIRAFSRLGTKDKPFRFVFVSGMGVTQAEQTGVFTPIFASTKGRVERELVKAETETFKTVAVRPSGIIPTPEVSLLPPAMYLEGARACTRV